MTIEYEKLKQCILCSSTQIINFDSRSFLSKCSACGLVYDNPRPTLSAISRYYSEKGRYEPWLQNEEGLNKQWKNLLKRIMQFKASGDLLDIGAGIGQFLFFAKKYFNVFGTEISTEAIAIAKEKFDVNLSQGEIEQVDFGDRQFDILVMHQVLEHLQNPGGTIDHCRSLLKPGGIFYVSVPNEAPYSLRMIAPAILSLLGRKKYKAFSLKGFRKIDFDSMEEIHLSHFSESTLKNAIKQKGFEIVSSNIDFIDPLIYSKWPVQIIRHVVFSIAYLIRLVLKINIYNCLWIAAKKKAD
jgi:SAM-dependent methyltransferase